MTMALEVEDMRVQVKPHFWSAERHILRGVTFGVEAGEIFGFLGPNGAGKTTTITTILGLIRPTAGKATLLGGTIRDPEIRRRVGFMPEHATFPENLTAYEVLHQHAVMAGTDLKSAPRRARETLERVGLLHAANRRLRHFSKGMLQRVGLGQAVIGRPDLVILDEPMSGLDPMGRRDFRDMMFELRDRGTTVFFSTHILPDVELICDRVAILAAGKVRRIGQLESLLGGDEAVRGVEITADHCQPETLVACRGLDGIEVQERLGAACVVRAESPDVANRALDLLRQSGSRIRSVQPLRPSLEDVFVSELAGTDE